MAAALLTVAALISGYQFVWSGTKGVSPDQEAVAERADATVRVRCHACNRTWEMTVGDYVSALRQRPNDDATGITCPHCGAAKVWREEKWVDQSDKFPH